MGLHAIFVFYASKRKMTSTGSSKSSRRFKAKPTMFMTDPDFNRFCFDFDIVPDLITRPFVRRIFSSMLTDYSSGPLQEEDSQVLSPEHHQPGISFEGFIHCIAHIAIKCALWPGSGPSEQVFALLQSMERSRGKSKIAKNGRCTTVIGPFRSTVKTPRKKMKRQVY